MDNDFKKFLIDETLNFLNFEIYFDLKKHYNSPINIEKIENSWNLTNEQLLNIIEITYNFCCRYLEKDTLCCKWEKLNEPKMKHKKCMYVLKDDDNYCLTIY